LPPPRTAPLRPGPRLVRRARAALFTLPLAVAACSCPGTKALVDDFEGCTGTCGWTVKGGSAAVVSTILPGEHGLRIDDGATAAKSVGPFLVDTTYSLQLVADCPNGLSATVSAGTPAEPSLSIDVMLVIDNTLDSSGNAPDYTGLAYVPLAGDITLPNGVMSASVKGVTLTPAKGGPCTVDLVRITSTPPCGSS
jgi:hypothetical protein